MNSIKVTKEEKNLLLSQIKLMREDVWKNRMNAIPIGIMMVKRNQFKVVNQNTSLSNLLKKIFES